MKSELINQIFVDVSQSYEYDSADEILYMNDVQSVQGKAINKVVGNETYKKIEELVSSSECESERCGFIMGFKYAMRLMQECFNPTGQNI